MNQIFQMYHLDFIKSCRKVFLESLVAVLHLELEVVHVRLHFGQPAEEVGHALVEAEIQNNPK